MGIYLDLGSGYNLAGFGRTPRLGIILSCPLLLWFVFLLKFLNVSSMYNHTLTNLVNTVDFCRYVFKRLHKFIVSETKNGTLTVILLTF